MFISKIFTINNKYNNEYSLLIIKINFIYKKEIMY